MITIKEVVLLSREQKNTSLLHLLHISNITSIRQMLSSKNVPNRTKILSAFSWDRFAWNSTYRVGSNNDYEYRTEQYKLIKNRQVKEAMEYINKILDYSTIEEWFLLLFHNTTFPVGCNEIMNSLETDHITIDITKEI